MKASLLGTTRCVATSSVEQRIRGSVTIIVEKKTSGPQFFSLLGALLVVSLGLKKIFDGYRSEVYRIGLVHLAF